VQHLRASSNQISIVFVLLHNYLREGGYVFAGFCLSVCVCVCVYKITQKVPGRIFLKFWG